MARKRWLLGTFIAAFVAASAVAMAAGAAAPKGDSYFTAVGPAKAPVVVQAFYPLSATGEDHTWVLAYGRKLVAAYPGKVFFIAYDYTKPKGSELWMKYNLTCGAFIINGKKEATVKGKRLSFPRDTTLGMWTYTQLKAAVGAEVRHPSRRPKPEFILAQATPPAPAEAKRTTVSILVPCGLAGPYGDIVRAFYKHHPQIRMATSVNGVVAMLKQLRDGKVSTDIYLALGSRELKEPALGDRLVSGSMVPCATIPLAVVVPKANPNNIRTLADLASPGVKTILTYTYNLSGGQGAREALQSAKLWDQLEPKMLTPKVPDQCKLLLKEGKAEAAIVYRTCLKESYIPDKPPIEEKDLLAAVTLSPDLYEPVTVGAALVKGTQKADAARVFIRFLAGPEAKAVWKSWGFGPVK